MSRAESSNSVDFTEIRRRLDEARDATEAWTRSGDEVLDPQAVQAVLQRRAETVAGRRREEVRQVHERVIAIRRAGEVLGVPIHNVREVRKIRVCHLPGIAPPVLGLFQVRGEVHCLVDVQAFFGASETPPHGAEILALLVEGGPGLLGLRIDSLVGPRDIYDDDLGGETPQVDFVREVTRDLLSILDVDRLFQRPEVHVETGGRDTATAN